MCEFHVGGMIDTRVIKDYSPKDEPGHLFRPHDPSFPVLQTVVTVGVACHGGDRGDLRGSVLRSEGPWVWWHHKLGQTRRADVSTDILVLVDDSNQTRTGDTIVALLVTCYFVSVFGFV